MLIQTQFAERAAQQVKDDESVIGLAVAGSWLTNEVDEFSDLDLVLVTYEKVSHDKTKMLRYAERFGELLTGFTGEHVGEPRLLICLYDNPLLHVDIKFVTLEEFRFRVETPVVLLDKDNQLKKVIDETKSQFPFPDFQWIEDRFWIWIHYALLKIGRGEYMEAFDFLSYLRMVVLGPLQHMKNGNLPRGVRKVEMLLTNEDFEELKSTLPFYTKASLLDSLGKSVFLYRKLRALLFTTDNYLQLKTEEKVMLYFEQIKKHEEI